MRPYARELPTKSSETLPLELFDNPEFETVPPEELILTAEGVPGARARSRYFLQSGEFTWKPCTVHAYDPEDGTFEIKWEGSEVWKRVKRLNLVFDSEDPSRFELRLSTAMAWQKQAQDAMLFHRAAEGVRLSDGPLHYLDERWELSVHDRSGSLTDHWPMIVSEVLDEARMEYDVAVRQARTPRGAAGCCRSLRLAFLFRSPSGCSVSKRKGELVGFASVSGAQCARTCI